MKRSARWPSTRLKIYDVVLERLIDRECRQSHHAESCEGSEHAHGALTTHSNRVSSNRSLCFRETEFLSRRQGGREGSEALGTALQRQNLAKQPAYWGLLPATGKSWG